MLYTIIQGIIMKRKSVLIHEIHRGFQINTQKFTAKWAPICIVLRSARVLWELTNIIKIQRIKVSKT